MNVLRHGARVDEGRTGLLDFAGELPMLAMELLGIGTGEPLGGEIPTVRHAGGGVTTRVIAEEVRAIAAFP